MNSTCRCKWFFPFTYLHMNHIEEYFVQNVMWSKFVMCQRFVEMNRFWETWCFIWASCKMGLTFRLYRPKFNYARKIVTCRSHQISSKFIEYLRIDWISPSCFRFIRFPQSSWNSFSTDTRTCLLATYENWDRRFESRCGHWCMSPFCRGFVSCTARGSHIKHLMDSVFKI